MRVRHLIFYAVALLFISACEEVVNLDIPEEPPRLVVNFIMEAGINGFVEISQSKSVLSSAEAQRVSDAIITLYDEDGNSSSFGKSKSPGLYLSSLNVEAGKTYTLRVEKEGFEPIEAEATIPYAVKIKRVSYDTTHVIPNNDTLNRDVIRTNVQLHLDDPSQEHNYYAVLVRRVEERDRSDEEGSRTNNVLYSTSLMPLSSKDPAVVSSNSQLVQSDGRIYGRTLLFDDHLFDGTNYTVQLELDAYFSENSTDRGFIVNLITISEHHYRYIQAKQFQQYRSEDPFTEPIRVPNNIANGFGIFAGYSRDEFWVHFN